MLQSLPCKKLKSSTLYPLYISSAGLAAEVISEESSLKGASIAVIPVTAVSEILSYAGVCEVVFVTQP